MKKNSFYHLSVLSFISLMALPVLAGMTIKSKGTIIQVTGPLSPADFQARCSGPGVLRCVGFDAAADIAGIYGDNTGILTSSAPLGLDTSLKASGNSSLKFTIPSNSGSGASGSYFAN